MYIKRMRSKLVKISLSLRRDALIRTLRCNNGNHARSNTAHKYIGDWAIPIRGQIIRIRLHQQMTQMWHCTETYSNGVRNRGE
jgi:hypothetical protein